MARYPTDFVQRLKDAVSVSSVVGARVKLQRKGKEYQGLCPFHKEKTPSFTVNDAKGFYHCFGCGAHGDAIGFIKEYEGIHYGEAIEKLALELGMSLPARSVEAEAKERHQRSLQDVHELACRWFQQQLAATHGQEARDYISERGLSSSISETFRIGLAPADGGAFKRAMLAEGVSENELIEAGLLIRPDDANRESYARFRSRIIFPIRDRRSRVIAFGGRLFGQADSKAPKYLNSPETPIFHKGYQLYNLDLAQQAARDAGFVLVAEGYMDVIALAQAGFHQAVAPLGTAMTAQQLQLLWQLVDEPYLCLDGDAAGERAMLRIAEIALPLLVPGKSLRFITMPQGQDPDSYIRQEGRAAFMALKKRAQPLVQMLCQHELKRQADTPEERAAQEQALYAHADRIANPIVKAHYRAHIRDHLWQSRSRSKPTTPATGGMRGAQVHISQRQALKMPHLPGGTDLNTRKQRAVLYSFAILLAYPQLWQEESVAHFVSEAELFDSGLTKIQQALEVSLQADRSKNAQERLAELACSCDTSVLRQLQQWFARDIALSKAGGNQDEALRTGYQLWKQAQLAYRQACLTEEYQQATTEMASSMSEANLRRVTALQQELEAIQRQSQSSQQDVLFEDS